jgi:hypothetical protein
LESAMDNSQRALADAMLFDVLALFEMSVTPTSYGNCGRGFYDALFLANLTIVLAVAKYQTGSTKLFEDSDQKWANWSNVR